MLDALNKLSILSPDESGLLDQRIYGVATAQVINNLDSQSLGRVQLRLPWLPGFEPWARVAVLASGMSCGTYFIPQIGDEVLVAFNQGDVREPYVVGCLWNSLDRPPALATTDPVTKRTIRTITGNEIAIDETTQSITITTSTGQKVSLDPAQIKLSTTAGTASVTLSTSGSLTIEAALSIELKAPSVSINATKLDLKADATAALTGSGECSIKGGLVRIN